MKTILHKASSRGNANHGWLNSYHTFSFASYYNEDRTNFGALRVLNDDVVSGGKGFDTHPHSNMEIFSLPLKGDLIHRDSMGNQTVIQEGDVQVMSAGTGVYHSEYNKNNEEAVEFLQIWVVPNMLDVDPRYDQISLSSIRKENTFYQVLSPNENDAGVWIYQDAYFSMGEFTENAIQTYRLNNPQNGVYVFVLEGKASINKVSLERRDGLAITETEEIKIEVKYGTKILLMEVPLI